MRKERRGKQFETKLLGWSLTGWYKRNGKENERRKIRAIEDMHAEKNLCIAFRCRSWWAGHQVINATWTMRVVSWLPNAVVVVVVVVVVFVRYIQREWFLLHPTRESSPGTRFSLPFIFFLADDDDNEDVRGKRKSLGCTLVEKYCWKLIGLIFNTSEYSSILSSQIFYRFFFVYFYEILISRNFNV